MFWLNREVTMLTMNLSEILSNLSKNRIPPPGNLPPWLLDMISAWGNLRGRVSELSSIERVLTTVRYRKPDRVPVSHLVGAAGRQITGVSFPEFSKNPVSAAETYLEGQKVLGGDFIILLQDLSVEAADFGQEIIYPENSTAHPNYNNPAVRDVDDYKKIRPIPINDTVRMKNYLEMTRIVVQRAGLRALPIGFLFGPLGVLSMMRGAQRLFRDCVLEKKAVMAACENITETLIEFAVAQCRIGAPAIAIDTLFASYSGIPKALWEEIEGPFTREIAQAVVKEGAFMGFHNCGHGPFFDAQIRFMEPGFISFAHLPDDCQTPQELKKRYGKAATLVGHVPTQLLYGPPNLVMEECRRQIELYADGGGFVLAPGCEYPPNISLINAVTIIKTAKLYG